MQETPGLGWMQLRDARILVVDDDTHAVRALCRVLEEVGAEVQSAMSVRSALECIGQSDRFDAAVVDYFLVGQLGKALLRPLRDQLTSTLIISGLERVDVASQAISAGADDFLLKPFEVPVFLEAVAKLVSKTRLWRHKMAEIRHGVKSQHTPPSSGRVSDQLDRVVDIMAGHSGLSVKERQVVRFVVDSFTSDQISERMGITVSTVKYHDKRAREKLGVRTRDELRRMVFRLADGQNVRLPAV